MLKISKKRIQLYAQLNKSYQKTMVLSNYTKCILKY